MLKSIATKVCAELALSIQQQEKSSHLNPESESMEMEAFIRKLM
jgi:hypothetical protein